METPPDIKAKILEDIQKNGISITDAATRHNISYKTIHNWIRIKSMGTSVSWGDYHRLKNENHLLKEIIGELTLQNSRTKKI